MEQPKAHIFQRPKSSTQSGRAHAEEWQLIFQRAQSKRHDPLTGWLGSGDTRAQVVLSFPSCDAAVAYAKAMSYEFEIAPTSPRRLKIQAYADNFR